THKKDKIVPSHGCLLSSDGKGVSEDGAWRVTGDEGFLRLTPPVKMLLFNANLGHTSIPHSYTWPYSFRTIYMALL
ncbi:MAG: hypothetical protein D6694_11485, partial [Gammaproteobacteria bacterium]